MLVPSWNRIQLRYSEVMNGLLLGLLWLFQIFQLRFIFIQPTRTLTYLLVFTFLYIGLFGLHQVLSTKWKYRWSILTDGHVLYCLYCTLAIIFPKSTTSNVLWYDKWGVGLVVAFGGLGISYLSRPIPHWGVSGYTYRRISRNSRVTLARLLVGTGTLIILIGALTS